MAETWPHRLAMPADRLLAQVQSVLGRGYRPASAHDCLERGGRLVHVTFDDAFRNLHEAVPGLERLGVPITVFVCTGYADRGGAPLTVPELATDDPKELEGLATMGWDELRGLSERGIEIAAHTVSHPHLPLLSDEELARELRESKERIEAELSLPCRFLAYPYGDRDSRVQAAARTAGFDAAFALKASRRRLDRYAVPRVDLYRRDTPFRTRLKTTALLQPFRS